MLSLFIWVLGIEAQVLIFTPQKLYLLGNISCFSFFLTKENILARTFYNFLCLWCVYFWCLYFLLNIEFLMGSNFFPSLLKMLYYISPGFHDLCSNFRNSSYYCCLWNTLFLILFFYYYHFICSIQNSLFMYLEVICKINLFIYYSCICACTMCVQVSKPWQMRRGQRVALWSHFFMSAFRQIPRTGLRLSGLQYKCL